MKQKVPSRLESELASMLQGEKSLKESFILGSKENPSAWHLAFLAPPCSIEDTEFKKMATQQLIRETRTFSLIPPLLQEKHVVFFLFYWEKKLQIVRKKSQHNSFDPNTSKVSKAG